MQVNSKDNYVALSKAVRMFPTPRTEGFDAGAHRGKPDSLHSFVKMLPTPRPCSGLRSSGANRTELYRAMGANGLLPTPHANCHTGAGTHGDGGPNLQTVIGGSLNPEFVEWLQGFPIGWTDV